MLTKITTNSQNRELFSQFFSFRLPYNKHKKGRTKNNGMYD